MSISILKTNNYEKNNICINLCIRSFIIYSSDDLNNDNYEEYCNQSYTINGGPGCPFNGAYHGWCSEAEFDEFAQSVYDFALCEAPVKKKNVPKLEP
ncbi:hypothetical protein VDP25_11120 [Winogradskyella sp. ECml5-4]|uniref:hypothetical protein n=1 Tax=Winogradskyella sp. ECml5-4 TaxID=3110975 RepID=UPI002FF1765F